MRLNAAPQPEPIPIPTKYGRNGEAFEVLFKMPSYEERIADTAATSLREYEADPDRATALRRAQLNSRFGFIVGWNDVEDQHGNPVTFSKETLRQLVATDPIFAVAVLHAATAFFVLGSGLPQTKRPKSEKQPNELVKPKEAKEETTPSASTPTTSG